MKQPYLWELPPIESDVVLTSRQIAKDIIAWCKPNGLCLDPCAGDFAFYDELPFPKDWCEIRRGNNFFEYDKKIDWIVGNPPYSIFEEWLFHSQSLAKHVVYLLPTNKIFQRRVIMEMIDDWGGIRAMRPYGSGQSIGLPFGFSVAAFHFEKRWNGPTQIDFAYDKTSQWISLNS